jgi:hypothetical protein
VVSRKKKQTLARNKSGEKWHLRNSKLRIVWCQEVFHCDEFAENFIHNSGALGGGNLGNGRERIDRGIDVTSIARKLGTTCNLVLEVPKL